MSGIYYESGGRARKQCPKCGKFVPSKLRGKPCPVPGCIHVWAARRKSTTKTSRELQNEAAQALLGSVKWDLGEANKLLAAERKRGNGEPNKLVRRLIRRAGGYDAAAEVAKEIWSSALFHAKDEARSLLASVGGDVNEAVSLVREVATKPIVCDRALETFFSPQVRKPGDEQLVLASCSSDIEKAKLAYEKRKNQQQAAKWLLDKAGSVDIAIATVLDVAANPKPKPLKS